MHTEDPSGDNDQLPQKCGAIHFSQNSFIRFKPSAQWHHTHPPPLLPRGKGDLDRISPMVPNQRRNHSWTQTNLLSFRCASQSSLFALCTARYAQLWSHVRVMLSCSVVTQCFDTWKVSHKNFTIVSCRTLSHRLLLVFCLSGTKRAKNRIIE